MSLLSWGVYPRTLALHLDTYFTLVPLLLLSVYGIYGLMSEPSVPITSGFSYIVRSSACVVDKGFLWETPGSDSLHHPKRTKGDRWPHWLLL